MVILNKYSVHSIDLTPSSDLCMKTSSLVAALTVAVALTSLLSGQSSPTTPAQAENDDEVVKLSPFEVSAQANRGYVTTSSLSASRIAVPITELPASVVVINEKLIQDTVAFELRDTLSLVSGIQQSAPPQGTNEISMRGYTLVGAQRDGVRDHLMSTGSEA